MALPFFYIENLAVDNGSMVLDEATSKHVVQVLRMRIGEQLQLTNGRGQLVTAQINDDHKKHCTVTVLQTTQQPAQNHHITIAISPVKNNSRFEWFLEKATEIGVTQIIPLICERTEKQHFRLDRMKGILVSAMLQSQQVWLPELPEPIKFKQLIGMQNFEQKFIAHCEDENNKQPLTQKLINQSNNQLILIGPEGDFTKDEIELALQQQYQPVALGNTRLRTETAGIVAATLLVNR
jgi:16S rRNA (uracil1498-N3)-methyltransferase